MRRHGRSRACTANQSSKAETSWEFLVLGCEFKNLPNREIHEIREKEMKKTHRTLENDGLLAEMEGHKLEA